MLHREKTLGFTLVEMMAVLVIIATISVVVGKAMTRQGNASAAETVAHKVLVLMRQARSMAMDTGAVTQILVNLVNTREVNEGSRLSLVRNGTLGLVSLADGGVWLNFAQEEAGGSAVIEAIRVGAEVGTVTPTKGEGLPATLTFNLDGTVSVVAGGSSGDGVTVYIRDLSNTYRHKVIVYGMTGYSESWSRW